MKNPIRLVYSLIYLRFFSGFIGIGFRGLEASSTRDLKVLERSEASKKF
jgi:hypothetical protein